MLSQEDQNAFSQPIVSTGSHDLTTEEPSAETTIECQYKSPPSTVESINLRENESILKVWERAQRIVRIAESVAVIMNLLLTGIVFVLCNETCSEIKFISLLTLALFRFLT